MAAQPRMTHVVNVVAPDPHIYVHQARGYAAMPIAVKMAAAEKVATVTSAAVVVVVVPTLNK